MTEDAKLVGTAHTRAAMLAFLRNNSGEHYVKEIATAVGVSGISAGQLLAHMLKAGMIEGRKEKSGKLLYREANPSEPKVENSLVEVKHRKPRMVAAHQPIPERSEVEFIVGGVVIVLGRNPANGRLRITME